MMIQKLSTLRLEEFPNLLFVQIHTADGLTGLGETYFAAASVEAYLHEVAAPLLLGKDATDVEGIRLRLVPYLGFASTGVETRGNSAIDIALWDLAGKARQEPLWALLGGAKRLKGAQTQFRHAATS
jgi:galactonate dehydratase